MKLSKADKMCIFINKISIASVVIVLCYFVARTLATLIFDI